MRNWKHKAITAGFVLLNWLLVLCRSDYTRGSLSSFLLLNVLLYTAIQDLRTRTIPDWIHVVIVILGIIQMHGFNELIGAIIVPLPYFFAAWMKSGNMGGGDIKLMAALGLYLGALYGTLLSIVCLSYVVLAACIWRLVEGRRLEKMPFGPYVYSAALTLAATAL